MEINENLREEILTIVNNQLESNTPPETKQTLQRLVASGYSDLEAKKLIGQCIIVEIFDTIKLKRPFDIDRYTLNLKKLPEEPFDEDD